MNNQEIRKIVKNKIKKLGVVGAYKYHVIENAKAIKKQFPPLRTEMDKAYLINLAHGITIKGFKNANIFKEFNSLFVADNVIKDEVWDCIINDLIKIVDEH